MRPPKPSFVIFALMNRVIDPKALGFIIKIIRQHVLLFAPFDPPCQISGQVVRRTGTICGSCIGFHLRKTASASSAVGRNVPQIKAPPARSRATKPLNALGCGNGLAFIFRLVFAWQNHKAA